MIDSRFTFGQLTELAANSRVRTSSVHLDGQRPATMSRSQAFRPIPRRDDALASRVMVATTTLGRGVFARRRMPAGLVVGEIRGQVLDSHPNDAQYCMELGSGRILEPASPFRFLNHSCDPNCELFYWEDDPGQEDRLWLQTIRSIDAGEELLIDYCWPADAAIPCQCGAANCRGWVVDPEELHVLAKVAPQPEPGVAGLLSSS